MPTGYTAAVADGTITEFGPFVMQCARAMGACITMRDDPSDAPIPERFEPSTYYEEHLEDARKRLSWLRSLTPAEQETEAEAEHTKALEGHRKFNADRERENTRYQAMIDKVAVWSPPTEDHENLKDFMLEQLRISISTYENPEPTRLSGDAWYAKALGDAMSEVDWLEEKNAEEIERTEGRNKWLRELRASLAAKIEEE